ncbi:MAG: peptide MFS transporter [Streptococcaceae bacterium]|jgi:POT family proton-dependent oligopeptide transporter|nr:peptide MFS transporter [Streptococcaceae bacterium]
MENNSQTTTSEEFTRPQGAFGQPKGLFTLFFTEFWERFSYYGMRAILVYYLYALTTAHNPGLGLAKTQAMAIVSIYGALVYLSSVVGGWIADRLLGASRTIMIGAVFIMCGHIALAIPAGLPALFVSITLIVIGTGMLKPNVSNMVGHLYSKTDSRRDTGFNIFYVGINAGALLAPIVVGTVGQSYNYHVGFSLAAIGMLAALFFYYFGRMRTFPDIGREPGNPLKGNERTRFALIFIAAIIVLVAIIFWIHAVSGSAFIDNLINFLSYVAIAVPVLYFIRMFASKEVDSLERNKLGAYIPLFLSAIVFWAIEEQSSSVIAVWGETRTNLHPIWLGLHLTIDPSWYQLLNPLFIIVLTPIVVRIWNKLVDRQPSTIVKFGLGLILTGASYMIMMAPGLISGTSGRTSALWLVLMFAVQMSGELLVSPVGLSVSTKLAPRAFQSQLIAMWFLSDATSQAINAQIVQFFNKHTEIAFFGIVGLVGVIVGIILLFIKNPMNKLMGDVR